MKKKIIAAAAVCVISAACVFGATACSNSGGSGQSSVQVGSEEAWNAAFQKTGNATNYKQSVYAYYDDIDETNAPVKVTLEGTTYRVGNEAYSVMTTSYSNGAPADTRYEYALIGENHAYTASKINDEKEWYVMQGNSIGATLMPFPYSQFAYKGGKYTATLTEYGGEENLTVKINADGYVFYTARNYTDEDGSSLTEYTFSDFGTASCEMPADAKLAIANYKAANA
ncbi:MAG: hypothetical protein NC033_02160 [Clostridiales bacterium]|nr:hypothetical protein [Clostridiales bacterium]